MESQKRSSTSKDKMVEIIQQWQYLGKPHPKLLKDKAFEHCKKARATSLQSYIFWVEIEKEPGKIVFLPMTH